MPSGDGSQGDFEFGGKLVENLKNKNTKDLKCQLNLVKHKKGLLVKPLKNCIPSTPAFDRGVTPGHFAGFDKGFNKWEEVLLITNVCTYMYSELGVDGPEEYTRSLRVLCRPFS